MFNDDTLLAVMFVIVVGFLLGLVIGAAVYSTEQNEKVCIEVSEELNVKTIYIQRAGCYWITENGIVRF